MITKFQCTNIKTICNACNLEEHHANSTRCVRVQASKIHTVSGLRTCSCGDRHLPLPAANTHATKKNCSLRYARMRNDPQLIVNTVSACDQKMLPASASSHVLKER